MEKITHIICFAVKLIIALLIVGGMVFIITVKFSVQNGFCHFYISIGIWLADVLIFLFLLLSQSGSDL